MREKATEISDTALLLEASAKKAERMIPEYLAAKRSQSLTSLTRQSRRQIGALSSTTTRGSCTISTNSRGGASTRARDM